MSFPVKRLLWEVSKVISFHPFSRTKHSTIWVTFSLNYYKMYVLESMLEYVLNNSDRFNITDLNITYVVD